MFVCLILCNLPLMDFILYHLSFGRRCYDTSMLFLIQLAVAQTNIYPNTAYFKAGPFVRGSGRSTDESPRHEVYLSEFYIDKYEVSIADFEHFVQKAYNNDDLWSKEGQTWKKQRKVKPIPTSLD